MSDDLVAFEAWLDGDFSKSMTRRDFAKQANSSMEDLVWAFCSGWHQRGKKENQEWKETFKNE